MALLVSSVAYADEPVFEIPSSVHVKQGFVIPWDDPQSGFSNMSTVTVMETKPWDKLGLWNALWAGNSIDVAWAYDANTSNVGVMFGRRLGTLGDYLPIEYPLAKYMDITLYPFGIIVEHPTDEPHITGATGAAIIKLDIVF